MGAAISSAEANATAAAALAVGAESEIIEWYPLTTPFPIASAGGPYVGDAGSPVMLQATATADQDTPVALLTYSWDTDLDGAFDDATGATPLLTFSAAYDELVGVRVLDTDGNSDVAYARITINKSNSPPDVVDEPTDVRLVTEPGKTLVFSITASDADSDTLAVIWKLNDTVVQAGGMSYTFQPGTADVVHAQKPV